MSRSGYSDDYDDENGALAMYRGVIASATRGKRGQRFFRDLVAALDALPAKRLVANNLEADGEVCALGAVGKYRGIDLEPLEDCDTLDLGSKFDIAAQLAAETMYENDEGYYMRYGELPETPEHRWMRIRKWAAEQIRVTPDELEPLASAGPGTGETGGGT